MRRREQSQHFISAAAKNGGTGPRNAHGGIVWMWTHKEDMGQLVRCGYTFYLILL